MLKNHISGPKSWHFFFSTSTRFSNFPKKSKHQFLNHFWSFWQFGPSRPDSQELFAPVMLIYVAGSYTWTQKVTIFYFYFELRFLANSSPSPEKLSKPPSCILIHDASLCIIMMILIHDSWSWNTVNNESFCITMHHGHEPWCIVMYRDDQSPSTSTCSTFPDWGISCTETNEKPPNNKNIGKQNKCQTCT